MLKELMSLMLLSIFTTFKTFLNQPQIVLVQTTSLYKCEKVVTFSRYLSKVSITHNWGSSEKPMIVTDMGGLLFKYKAHKSVSN